MATFIMIFFQGSYRYYNICFMNFNEGLCFKTGLQEHEKKVGMGTNTENGIRIFGITIRIYSNIRFGRPCLRGFRRSFPCPGTEHTRILVQYTIKLRCGNWVWGFYKLFRIRLLVNVQ